MSRHTGNIGGGGYNHQKLDFTSFQTNANSRPGTSTNYQPLSATRPQPASRNLSSLRQPSRLQRIEDNDSGGFSLTGSGFSNHNIHDDDHQKQQQLGDGTRDEMDNRQCGFDPRQFENHRLHSNVTSSTQRKLTDTRMSKTSGGRTSSKLTKMSQYSQSSQDYGKNDEDRDYCNDGDGGGGDGGDEEVHTKARLSSHGPQGFYNNSAENERLEQMMEDEAVYNDDLADGSLLPDVGSLNRHLTSTKQEQNLFASVFPFSKLPVDYSISTSLQLDSFIPFQWLREVLQVQKSNSTPNLGELYSTLITHATPSTTTHQPYTHSPYQPPHSLPTSPAPYTTASINPSFDLPHPRGGSSPHNNNTFGPSSFYQPSSNHHTNIPRATTWSNYHLQQTLDQSNNYIHQPISDGRMTTGGAPSLKNATTLVNINLNSSSQPIQTHQSLNTLIFCPTCTQYLPHLCQYCCFMVLNDPTYTPTPPLATKTPISAKSPAQPNYSNFQPSPHCSCSLVAASHHTCFLPLELICERFGNYQDGLTSFKTGTKGSSDSFRDKIASRKGNQLGFIPKPTPVQKQHSWGQSTGQSHHALPLLNASATNLLTWSPNTQTTYIPSQRQQYYSTGGSQHRSNRHLNVNTNQTQSRQHSIPLPLNKPLNPTGLDHWTKVNQYSQVASLWSYFTSTHVFPPHRAVNYDGSSSTSNNQTSSIQSALQKIDVASSQLTMAEQARQFEQQCNQWRASLHSLWRGLTSPRDETGQMSTLGSSFYVIIPHPRDGLANPTILFFVQMKCIDAVSSIDYSDGIRWVPGSDSNPILAQNNQNQHNNQNHKSSLPSMTGNDGPYTTNSLTRTTSRRHHQPQYNQFRQQSHSQGIVNGEQNNNDASSLNSSASTNNDLNDRCECSTCIQCYITTPSQDVINRITQAGVPVYPLTATKSYNAFQQQHLLSLGGAHNKTSNDPHSKGRNTPGHFSKRDSRHPDKNDQQSLSSNNGIRLSHIDDAGIQSLEIDQPIFAAHDIGQPFDLNSAFNKTYLTGNITLSSYAHHNIPSLNQQALDEHIQRKMSQCSNGTDDWDEYKTGSKVRANLPDSVLSTAKTPRTNTTTGKKQTIGTSRTKSSKASTATTQSGKKATTTSRLKTTIGGGDSIGAIESGNGDGEGIKNNKNGAGKEPKSSRKSNQNEQENIRGIPARMNLISHHNNSYLDDEEESAIPTKPKKRSTHRIPDDTQTLNSSQSGGGGDDDGDDDDYYNHRNYPRNSRQSAPNNRNPRHGPLPPPPAPPQYQPKNIPNNIQSVQNPLLNTGRVGGNHRHTVSHPPSLSLIVGENKCERLLDLLLTDYGSPVSSVFVDTAFVSSSSLTAGPGGISGTRSAMDSSVSTQNSTLGPSSPIPPVDKLPILISQSQFVNSAVSTPQICFLEPIELKLNENGVSQNRKKYEKIYNLHNPSEKPLSDYSIHNGSSQSSHCTTKSVLGGGDDDTSSALSLMTTNFLGSPILPRHICQHRLMIRGWCIPSVTLSIFTIMNYLQSNLLKFTVRSTLPNSPNFNSIAMINQYNITTEVLTTIAEEQPHIAQQSKAQQGKLTGGVHLTRPLQHYSLDRLRTVSIFNTFQEFFLSQYHSTPAFLIPTTPKSDYSFKVISYSGSIPPMQHSSSPLFDDTVQLDWNNQSDSRGRSSIEYGNTDVVIASLGIFPKQYQQLPIFILYLFQWLFPLLPRHHKLDAYLEAIMCQFDDELGHYKAKREELRKIEANRAKDKWSLDDGMDDAHSYSPHILTSGGGNHADQISNDRNGPKGQTHIAQPSPFEPILPSPTNAVTFNTLPISAFLYNNALRYTLDNHTAYLGSRNTKRAGSGQISQQTFTHLVQNPDMCASLQPWKHLPIVTIQPTTSRSDEGSADDQSNITTPQPPNRILRCLTTETDKNSTKITTTTQEVNQVAATIERELYNALQLKHSIKTITTRAYKELDSLYDAPGGIRDGQSGGKSSLSAAKVKVIGVRYRAYLRMRHHLRKEQQLTPTLDESNNSALTTPATGSGTGIVLTNHRARSKLTPMLRYESSQSLSSHAYYSSQETQTNPSTATPAKSGKGGTRGSSAKALRQAARNIIAHSTEQIPNNDTLFWVHLKRQPAK